MALLVFLYYNGIGPFNGMKGMRKERNNGILVRKKLLTMAWLVYSSVFKKMEYYRLVGKQYLC